MFACKAIRCSANGPRISHIRCMKQLWKSNLTQFSIHFPPRYSFDPKPIVSRFFASSIIASNEEKSDPEAVRILYGSQGGTAQLFAMQLSEELEERHVPVEVMALNEANQPAEHLEPGKALHVFLVSVAGVGEPPNNAREFYNWLMDEKKQGTINDDDTRFGSLKYAVFGLGNQKAHPNHFNIIGKNLDKRLEELGANRVLPLGLGDDGECLEDDFDTWKNQFVKMILKHTTGDDESNEIAREVHEDDEQTDFAVFVTEQKAHNDSISSDQSPAGAEKTSRRTNDKYPVLKLDKNTSPLSCQDDLFHLQPTVKPFYQEGTCKLPVVANRLLGANSGESGLRELQISLTTNERLYYEAGDHLIVYPCNASCVVEAYFRIVDVDPNTVIGEPEVGSQRSRAYPHPVGITLHETLTHCVDLGASPSPTFARKLAGKQDIDYREDIVESRRTVLDLAHESGYLPSVEELLFNLPPMKPRYYSIASSSLVHPNDVIITYRPVKYVTNRGYLREGVCTSYLNHLGAGETSSSHVAAAIRSNPTFRLPKDKETPILMIAGGCGIAPIRAFLEERIATASSSNFGPGHLYLGFRSPADEVYRPIVQMAQDCGAITNVKVTYSTGCSNPALVSTAVRDNGADVFSLLQDGGYVYMCGGARAFGAAVEREILGVFQEHGKMSLEHATDYLRTLISEGRLCEDLAD